MDQIAKGKWLIALRSGKYKQGSGRLRSRDDTYCCLGVLCDVAIESGWTPHKGERDPSYTMLGANAYLPLKFGLHVGISGEREDDITRMNDGAGEPVMSFNDIADWIEENL